MKKEETEKDYMTGVPRQETGKAAPSDKKGGLRAAVSGDGSDTASDIASDTESGTAPDRAAGDGSVITADSESDTAAGTAPDTEAVGTTAQDLPEESIYDSREDSAQEDSQEEYWDDDYVYDPVPSGRQEREESHSADSPDSFGRYDSSAYDDEGGNAGEDFYDEEYDHEYDTEYDDEYGDEASYEEYEEDEDVTASRAAADAARERSSRARRKRAHRVLAQRAGVGILIAAAAALVVVYIVGCVHFSSHFMFGTTLNGTDVSGLSEEGVEEALLAAAEDYVLTIEGRGNLTDTIEGAVIDLEPVFDGTIGTLIAQQNVFLWPASLFTATELISDSTASYDEAALEELIADLVFLKEENITAPTDATYILGENGLEIVPEDNGSEPDTEGLTASIVTALDGFVAVLTLDDSCYVPPAVTSDSAELLETIEALTALMDTGITLVFDDGAEAPLDGGSVLAMLICADGTAVADNTSEGSDPAADAVILTAASVTGYVEAEELTPDEEDSDADTEADDSTEENDSEESLGESDTDLSSAEDAQAIATAAETDTEDSGILSEAGDESSSSAESNAATIDLTGVLGTSFTYSEELVAAYVDALADQYDTYGKDIVFHTTSGRNVEVPGGNYGWLMDRDATTAALMELLNSGEGGELAIVWTQTAEQFGSDDIGDTYAEVDLDEQKVYLYVDGELVLETDCVSGKATDSGRYTPDGVFRITYRKSPATLTGTDYVSYVTYWMPFNSGIGFHDATWRSSFGGSIYISNGSHGCINLPYDAAEELYSYVYSGMPVIVFGGVVPSETDTAAEDTTATTTVIEEEGSSTEQAATEASIIEQAIANYVATGMTQEDAAAQVEADLAAQLAEQQAAAEAAEAAAAQAAATQAAAEAADSAEAQTAAEAAGTE